ncbi:MAG: transcriptional regulator NrdR [Acidobacteriota bacterium]
MKCPYCSYLEDRVVDSREGKDGLTIRRRRECLSCSRRFTSYERIEEIAYMAVKRDGSRVPFERAKIMSGLLKACEKRPVPRKSLEDVADEIESRLSDQADREIATEAIGSHVMKRLRDLDQVAYVRFASVYRRFEDVAEFMDELQGLIQRGKGRAGKSPARTGTRRVARKPRKPSRTRSRRSSRRGSGRR